MLGEGRLHQPVLAVDAASPPCHRGLCASASYRDLPVHQARQEEVAGLGEFLVLLIELAIWSNIGSIASSKSSRKQLRRNEQRVALERCSTALAVDQTHRSAADRISSKAVPSDAQIEQYR